MASGTQGRVDLAAAGGSRPGSKTVHVHVLGLPVGMQSLLACESLCESVSLAMMGEGFLPER